MSMTETRPDTEADAAPAPPEAPGATAEVPPEVAGFGGWLTTGDHKRIGRLWIAASMLFLLVGGVAGAVLNVERVDTGLQVLGQDAFNAVYTLHGTVAVFLFLVPLAIGLATVVVPLQVGASNIAFPRMAALGFWLYLIAGCVLLASYAAGGGPGGTDPDAVDLWLLALAAVNVATVLALLSVVTTALSLRAPGMSLRRTPVFTWSVVVGGGLALLSIPVLLAGLTFTFVAHHHAGAPLPGWGPVAWFFGLPQAYLLAVPAIGAVLEIVPVACRARPARHGLAMGAVAAAGILGFGAFTALGELDEPFTIGVAVASVLPALLVVALVGDAARRGKLTGAGHLLFALTAALLFLLGAVVGGLAVIEPLGLAGTTWMAAHVHLTLLGGATLGLLAGLAWWSPKIWGRLIPEGQLKVALGLLVLGVLALSLPDLVLGVLDQPLGAAEWETEPASTALNGVAAAGGVVTLLGVLAFAAALLGGLRRDDEVPADPWGGRTLEWSTASPPVRANFDGPVAPVTSATPLHTEPADPASEEGS